MQVTHTESGSKPKGDKMPWKRNEDGTLAMDDSNNPIRVDGDGKEYPMTDDTLDATLSNLGKANNEAAERKRKLRVAEEQLKYLEGIEDPKEYFKKAEKALETVKNLDDKKLVDAGEVENLKKSISDSYEKKMAKLIDTIELKDTELYQEKVSSRFAKSTVLEKTVLPADVAEAYFGKNFKIEDGYVVGYLGDEKIYSKENPGSLANFDEALSEIIEKYPMRDKIMKADPGGSGTPSQSGNSPKGKKTIPRSQFDKMGQVEKTAFMRNGGKPVDD